MKPILINRRYSLLIPALIALFVYLLTVCRTFYIGDGAEFALVLKTLGIAHPPGYPLLTIVGSVFVQMFFFLRPIVAANLFNVLIAVAAVAVLFLILRKHLTVGYATLISLAWAFMPAFWEQTVGIEIYNANLLLILLTLLVLESDSHYKWPLVFYLYGLCLNGNPTSLALAPTLIFVFFQEREYRHWRRIPIYLGLMALAGTLYFYLWIRSGQYPVADWGHPMGFDAWFHHLTLGQYRSLIGSSSQDVWLSTRLFGSVLLSSWWWIGVVGIVSGIYLGIRRDVARTLSLLLLLVTSFYLTTAHTAPDYFPHLLPALLACLLLLANNFTWLQERQLKQALPLAITALAVAIMLVTHYQSNDKSKYTFYEEYSRLILDSAGEGVLFTSGDVNSLGPVYLRYAENYRPELTVYDCNIRKTALFQQAARFGANTADYYQARATIFSNERRPIFLVKNYVVNEPEWLPGRDSLYSHGILCSMLHPFPAKAAVPDYSADFDPGDFMSRTALANLDLARGEEKLLLDPPDTTGSLTDFRQANKRLQYEPRGEFLNLIGAHLRQSGFGDLALESYREALNRPILSSAQKREIFFNMSNVYKDRGNSAHQRGDYATAVADYLEALNFDQVNAQLMLNIGLIYLQNLHDPENALIYLNKYLILEPNDTRVRNLIRSLGQGTGI
jgi:tetratricopeptide (TPR) repeat protein